MTAEKSFQAFGIAECRTQGREMLPTLAVDWQASTVRDKEAGRFHKVAGVSIVATGRRSTVDTFNHRQLSRLNKKNM